MKLRIRIGALAGCCALLASVAGCSSSAAGAGPSNLKLGVLVAQSGFLAEIDAPYLAGVQLAVKQLNRAGGVDGHKIVTYIEDEASTPTTMTSEVSQIASRNSPSAFIAGSDASGIAAAQPILASRQIPMVTLGVLPTADAWLFQHSFSVANILQVQLGYAAKQGYTRIAFVYGQSAAGQIASKLAAPLASAMHLTIIDNLGVSATATSLESEMSQVKSKNPQAVVTFDPGSGQLVLAQAAASVGLTVPLVQAQEPVPLAATANAYQNQSFVMVPTQIPAGVPDPSVRKAAQAFVSQFAKAGGSAADVGTAVYGYEVVELIADAVKKAHSTSASKINAALQTFTFTGATGIYRYTPQDHTGLKGVQDPLILGRLDGSHLAELFTYLQA